ncbi:mechanosensitive ion channel protein MscL [Paenibacillus sp. FSL R7-0273]|uniref:large conductance mechanosensitive channel protein MscL n=1 Tax=Paenibacillus sp. FSL R7-0273 TaxID=1536772 RepID=UPI0004F58A30|nr:large conductance mechanosensitive channel protein MscL [Paenibacillus sp. FSL R7-0273]AIQ48233.1 mechanosensitive ion channel protein MscL [Paenibacillus sp. FSL R7-0273]OMF91997.1 mechanosensitive ion channel protein MscL [Paenibacillus sp. FSL R7-0273]
MWKEFKSFAIKGNVLDLAVAVIIGAAFGKIVSSLVADIIMPLAGLLSGGVDLEKLTFTYLDAEVKYGVFLQSVVDFFIISFSIFMVVKLANRFKHKETVKVEVVETPAPDPEIALLTEIRDLLKANKQGEA